jgi:perosamine synthetase
MVCVISGTIKSRISNLGIASPTCNVVLHFHILKLDRFIGRRRELAKKYDEVFAGMKNCHLAQQIDRDLSGHHLYALRIDFERPGKCRRRLMRELEARQIDSQVRYIPVPAQPHYRRLSSRSEGYPNAQAYYQQALSIPLFFDLSFEQQDLIIETLQGILR